MLVVFLIIGKPQSIDLYVNPFLDSFEKTDYDDGGKIKQDYLPWKDKDYAIKVNYHTFYKWQKNPFNWKHKIRVKLENIKLPDGFQISSKKIGTWNETPSDFELELINCNGFLVKIEQIDNFIDLSQFQLIKFLINIIVDGTNIRETLHYDFLIGEDLGDSWISFDTGTTATAIAFNDNNEEIAIAKYKEKEEKEEKLLTPSVLVFDKHNVNNSFYGDDAERRIRNTENYTGFRSIKKLLGYKDINKEIGKTGKEIAAKLVSDIFNDLKQNNLIIQNAKRAIVAIPNNYTATKIKDMLFCIENLKQFKEIRTIYEPEAIVFYYMSNKSSLEEKFDCKNKNNNETILVFDMGGATINVTVAQISSKDKDTYEVNVLSKIGYGIGGDSIDYCILKSIFSFSTEIPDLQQINIFDKTVKEKLSEEEYKKFREVLIDLSFDIKKKIVENQRKTELISANDLDIYLKKALNKNISIDVESDFYRIFKSKSKFSILRNEYFTHLIYSSVTDAIKEVLDIAGKPKIEKIILAGRSSSFPDIENNIIGSFSYSPDLIDLNKIGTAKIAVAEGACWYALNNNSIKLNNLKTSSNFGFIKTKSPDKRDIQFVSMIMVGTDFTEKEQGQIKFTEKTLTYNDRFSFDGNKVNFYQVMSSDAEKIIVENQKHKYSKIATIKLSQESEKIGMRVKENDDVNCSVKLVSDIIEKEKSIVADQEIIDANEEHYTWIVN